MGTRSPGSSVAPLLVALDARARSGLAGGIESFVIGLAHGLGQLDDSPDEFVFLAYEGHDGWLTPHVGGSCRIQHVPVPVAFRRLRAWSAARMPALADRWRHRQSRRRVLGPPPSDGTIERLGVDIVHFTLQEMGFITAVPSIYHPHDLQHLHLPQYFTTEQIAKREALYRPLCRQAALIAVASSWTKRDIAAQYGMAEDKVAVIPYAPPTSAYASPTPDAVAEARRRLSLPAAFVLYPAQTWPHKNHLGLLRALARLRERGGPRVHLVCTGHLSDHYATLARAQQDLGLAGQATWLGFVSPADLQALYASATAVIVPTRFEAASFPLWEAFQAGVPAACSNVTSLPEQAGDAALIFDPDDTDAMADAIERLWTDDRLRADLAARGRRRVAVFDWSVTARQFRAHYRRLAGRPLSADDRDLIARDVGI